MLSTNYRGFLINNRRGEWEAVKPAVFGLGCLPNRNRKPICRGIPDYGFSSLEEITTAIDYYLKRIKK